MKKKLVSLMLTAALATSLLAGCGGNSEDAGSTPSASGTEQGDEGEAGDAEDEGTESFDEEPTEIVVGLMSLATVDQTVQDRIEEVVNKKMVEMINVTADFQWYDASTYGTQIPMMLSSGEQLDVMMFTPLAAASYSAFMGQGQLMDVSDYLEYAPDAVARLGESGVAATSKAGGVYGFGAILSSYATQGIIMSKSVLEEIGMLDAFNSMNSWDEFETILQAAADKGYTGLVNCDTDGTVVNPQPYLAADSDFANGQWVDVVGDGNYMVYADQETGKIVNFYGSEGYKNAVLRAADYYQKGLVYKDAASAADYAATQVKNGVGVAYTTTLEFGTEETASASCGQEMAYRRIEGSTAMTATGTYTKFGYTVPVTAQEPEAALKFINLLYSENEIHDTLTWGEEGVDWVKADGTANYIEGNETPEYHMQDFLFADIMTITPWGDNANLRKEQMESNAQVNPSRFIGFAIDNTAVVNEVTACLNVNNQYKALIASGTYGANTLEKYEEWMAALDAAGMQKILDEYQSQLDAWLASN